MIDKKSYVYRQQAFGNTDFITSSQYWAGIPVVITGILLIIAAFIQKMWLKTISVIFLLYSMVAILGVIVEETTNGGIAHMSSNICSHFDSDSDACTKVKPLAVWYKILLLASAILLVLCNVALLAIFGNWILFASKEQSLCNEQTEYQVAAEPRGVGFDNPLASAQPMTTSHGGYDGNVRMAQLPVGYSYN